MRCFLLSLSVLLIGSARLAQAESYSPTVRVNLFNQSVTEVNITIDGPYQIRPIGSKFVLTSGSELSTTRISTTRTGFRIGSKSLLVSRLEIVPSKSPSLWVKNHQYRGSIRLHRVSGDRFLVVNVVPLEPYLASVINGETPATFPDAAREAQTIVARTYALYQMQRRHPMFDVYASTRSQKYLGFQYRTANGRRLAGESKLSRKLVARTKGMVCLAGGKLFCTYYSAVCGGETLPGKQVFSDATSVMKRVSCPYCEPAKLYRWDRSIPLTTFNTQLTQHFKKRVLPFGKLKTISLVKGMGWDISDGKHTHRVTIAQFRRELLASPLPSSQFTLKFDPEKTHLQITGRGHGHGVGLCQWGAKGMAEANHSAIAIVQYYYPGCEVVILNQQPE